MSELTERRDPPQRLRGGAAPAPRGVEVVSPAPRAVWRAVLAADPHAVATQSPEWLDCLAAFRGRTDASRLYLLPDGRRLVLPLAARVCAGVRVAEESPPYGWGYGGALVDGGRLTDDDRALVLADLAARPVLRAGLTPVPLAGAGWSAAAPPGTVRSRSVAHVVDLGEGFDRLWSHGFRRQARNSVRKAERCGLDVRREDGTTRDPRGVAMFAQLYRQSVDRWAAQRRQPLPLARLLAARRDRPGQLAAAAAALGERCVVWSATRDGEPVAVNVVLQSDGHALGWLSAMDTAVARETLATYLLQSRAIEDAAGAGVRWFHMGESDPGSGSERFKQYFAAAPVEYETLRFERLPFTGAEAALRAALARATARRRGA